MGLAIVMAALLCTLLLLNGTLPSMVGCVFVYILLFTSAFNTCGGLRYPSGAYIFFNGVLSFIVGVVVKVITWEPAQNNLRTPEKTFFVFTVSMFMMWVAAQATVHFRAKKAVLQNIIKPHMIGQAVAGGVFMGVAVVVAVLTSSQEAGSFGAAVGQLGYMLPFSILIGTYYRTIETKGRSSVTFLILFSQTVLFLWGISIASKQTMFVGFVCWALGAAAGGHYMSRPRLIFTLAVVAIVTPYLSAYSQYARNDRELHANPFKDIMEIVSNPSRTLELGNPDEERKDDDYGFHFYDKPRGLFDRLQMIAPDDAIINLTDTNHEHGMQVVWLDLYNNVPRFLVPGKPVLHFGNLYAHELGMLAPDDVTTGISFSPTGEAYHVAAWRGTLLVLPLLLFAVFWLTDSLTGSTDHSPWPLLYLLVFSHMAPEGGIGALAYELGSGVLRLCALVVLIVYVTPLIGTLIVGPEKILGVFSTTTPRSVPRRVKN